MFRVAESIVLKHEYRDITSIAVATRQTLVATGTVAGTIHLWETTDGEALLVLSDAHKPMRINAMDFNAEGTVLASAGEDGRLVLWDLAELGSRVRFRYLEGHGSNVPLLCCVFSKSTTLLCTGGKDSEVRLWGNLGRPVCSNLRGHRNWVTCAAFSGDGAYVATGSFDHNVCIWNTSTFTIVQTIRRHEAPIGYVTTSTDGSVILSGDETGVVLVTRKDGTVLRRLLGHTDIITGICLLQSAGLILTSSHDWSIKVWTLKGQCVSSRKAHHGRVNCFAVSADEDFYVTGSDDFTAKIVPFVWDEAKRLQPEDVGRPSDVHLDEDEDDDAERP